jgi:hypothetical protein
MIKNEENNDQLSRQLDSMPQEILERIFSFTSEYRDFDNISNVCSKWSQIINGLRHLNEINFKESFQTGQIEWQSIEYNNSTDDINDFNNKNKIKSPTARHSHSSCRIKDCLYIFGGLTSTSTSTNGIISILN